MIELKKLDNTPGEERDELYRWAKLIAADSGEMMSMTAKGNPYMEEALSEMEQINMSETERYLYLRRSMAYTDEVSRLTYATQQGIEQGIEQGREESIKFTIQDALEFNVPKDLIIEKLKKRFSLTQKEAEAYFVQYN